jgi:hypothetical protein
MPLEVSPVQGKNFPSRGNICPVLFFMPVFWGKLGEDITRGGMFFPPTRPVENSLTAHDFGRRFLTFQTTVRMNSFDILPQLLYHG